MITIGKANDNEYVVNVIPLGKERVGHVTVGTEPGNPWDNV